MKASGINGQLELAGDLLLIKREGILAKAAFFGKGEKAIKVGALTSVELKPAGWLSRGFVHFVFSGIRNSRLMKMTSSPLFTDPRGC